MTYRIPDTSHPLLKGGGDLFQFLDNLLYIHRLQSSVHLFADHHYRSQSAGAYAAQAIQRILSVGGGFSDFAVPMQTEIGCFPLGVIVKKV